MTRQEILQRVLLCRKATVIANAFRKAFGLEPAQRMLHQAPAISTDTYTDISQCFANTYSQMDRIYGQTKS